MIQATTLRQALQELGELIIELMRHRLETNGRYPLRRGQSRLLDTLAVNVTQDGNAGPRMRGPALEVFAQDYARYVESGRRPGVAKIPLDALVQWVKRKRIGTRRGGKGQRKVRPDSVIQLARAIQQSIYKHGIRGRPFIQLAIDEGSRAFDAWLDQRALDLITADLDRALNLPLTR